MSKSYQKSEKRKMQPAPEGLKPLQLDETIICGQHERHPNDFAQHLTQSITDFFEQASPLDLTRSKELLATNDNALRILGILKAEGEDSLFDIEQFEQRIMSILRTKDLTLSAGKMKQYLRHLTKTTEHPCYLTGGDVFEWEEDFWNSGSGTQKKYESLKQEKACHTDVFQLKKFAPEFDEIDGFFVEVERTSDRKEFILPLIDLTVADENSLNYDLINDYCIWFINYDA
ncbi:MAG: hypothetical protein ACRC8A_03930 [Microcoleaceae cyanobacterium]